MKIYLAGCGKLGKKLGDKLSIAGHNVLGLKRQSMQWDFSTKSIDLSQSDAVKSLTPDADVIVFTVTPSDYSEAGYRMVYETILGHLLDFAKRHKVPPLFILVSSTGVYGQQNGEWVDENSETLPNSFSGRWVKAGEEQLKIQLDKRLIIRFSGIYGKDRKRLLTNAITDEPIQKIPPQWTNRVHEIDCVGTLAFLIGQYHVGKALHDTYLISDDTPVSSYDISAFICQSLGKPNPPIKSHDLSTQCNKRCSNNRIKSAGYQFIHPTYQSGYKAIIASLKES